MEGTQAAVRQGKYIPSGQEFNRCGKIPQRSCDKATASEKLAVVEIPAASRSDANGYSGVERSVGAWSDQEVEFLMKNYRTMTAAEIGIAIGRPLSGVKHRVRVLGLSKPKFRPPVPSGSLTNGRGGLTICMSINNVPQGLPERAADFLRIHDRVPMYRCDSIGRAAPKGEFWRYGNAVLADAEVIAKAQRKGWDENEWRTLSCKI